MTDQEKTNAEVDKRLSNLETEFEVFIQEMRDRDNQRAEDIREIATIIVIAAIVIFVLLK